MSKAAIFGAMTALITPFKNGKLDEAGYEKLIKRQIKYGVDAVVPVGTTGESATLTHDEHRVCIEIAVNACKNTNVKVLAGAGSNATHEAIGLAKFAQDHGADGVLSVAPYYNKPTQEGLYLHYKAIANSVDIPVLLYNVPGRTGCDILPETVIKLFNDCENIYGVKEASGSIDRCVDLLAHEPKLYVLSGEDAINYPILSNGGKGVISVTSNLLPDQTAALTHYALDNEFLKAKEINDKLYNINKIMFCESNPIPIKAAMFIAGLIDTLEYRLPLCNPSAANLKKIEEIMKSYDIKGF
ncbi:4-hydroxy-tetrahydrodipicolinate synthase [Campylobacter hyointestinalis]|uniref:4-hydroxy-tetrahydrodipicolinate synthase n=1 Tax=Campylobacter hyointestinalis subsp. hyointestinalis TaxID=91352 RepID=A0A9W5APJ0_CAMHY|nr:4-hydroxy-tetrahydrodipicolinate synthase [Campylobacter hyointestinalis]MDL2346605.1 4-hydroxy-tetrahydrodipicolinate synthase [Campylobacter hyointestinalis]MDL2348784.1 4-hydroxy-tetrahydrodipicolinate synthase [Campylobacter hyointestinalis]MDL2350090.1 4-hydroxy-tetrahydrodipicolinate synthase [Campylobacter hyointestinalis]MDM1026361.1 4-hydroxy-tetrahydrodipicolinate synthase [Campylobacter hyointestinalis]MDM1027535.1 4-hydroxy-tetrahydrodipicolinate synthase [Campylobacter hyointes